MRAQLITNIRLLVNTDEGVSLRRGADLAVLPCIENAWLLVEDGIIAGYGKMDTIGDRLLKTADRVDAGRRFVLPCWCDSHTHLVYAASREEEFIDKIKGLSYADIAAKGGGILNSAGKLNGMTEDELYTLAWRRLDEVSRQGTGAIEIKSGYGLTVEGELKMLRVIKRLKERSRVLIRSTFLGAHTFHLACKEYMLGLIDSLYK